MPRIAIFKNLGSRWEELNDSDVIMRESDWTETSEEDIEYLREFFYKPKTKKYRGWTLIVDYNEEIPKTIEEAKKFWLEEIEKQKYATKKRELAAQKRKATTKKKLEEKERAQYEKLKQKFGE